jgi:hypothetical protein
MRFIINQGYAFLVSGSKCHRDVINVHFQRLQVSAVIFAVDKTYPHPERLLGEHRWKEFLLNPDKSEAELKSQIFYCTYSTEREVQKDGTCVL